MADRNSPAKLRAFPRWPALLGLALAFDATAAVHALAGASVDGKTQAAAPAAPIEPVFDCYAANSAWGLTYSGKVVDRSGQVWSYRARGKSLPAAAGDNGRSYLEAAELAAKYAGATATNRIEAKILAEHSALIDKAAAGKVATTETGVRDAGTSTCHAYVFEAGAKRYRDVELGSDSGVADRRLTNDAPEAKALIDWLHTIGVAR